MIILILSKNYYQNKTAFPGMENVLVLTLPNTRNYSGVDWNTNSTVSVYTHSLLFPCSHAVDPSSDFTQANAG